MKISVQVKPRSKKQTIEKKDNDTWIVNLKSPPVDGKANQELITVIAKQFGVKKSQVIIKSGLSSPKKIIEIS
ncbi:DUF167 domain-containing protein [Cyanobacterium aponinum UTEX 3222]|uniref:UPF0235 protein Cyan10605_0367 n=1 Tax=Cyanobacterium aponinum (strain PCC 10605) TaxID=755178 RepID=K9Z1A3_CYAAP|nr:DUF167 domain-containing protein [Cyanobacterium aponinum]AFZ52512.1 UPF0235 protein yggU [Cyanobacterium aponinum PCC 10605]PHV63708.1 hypothetical protein CSQ80_03815 [Cyanobacterium aponinum IPPAS B-1201]WRL39269.1 DUF167 domain-containing protein [Cyanobacterium aponinum UTEX 3221]WRL40439.1 DUF167 domain-containing protein [Cyanobacterium aponinum UTEX 3222]